MILTCPACETKYVVKDGAIPPGGRQVRCASCKHSWHQDPEASPEQTGDDQSLAEAALIEPRSGPEAEERAYQEAVIADQAGPVPDDLDVATAPAETGGEFEPAGPPERDQWPQAEGQGDAEGASPPAPAAEWLAGSGRAGDPADEFEPFYDPDPAEEPRRRVPRLVWLLLVVAALAAAGWFLAPESLRQRLGMGSAGRSDLAVMVTDRSREALASGNELFAVSGRVINLTDRAQPVPPIKAELLDATRQKVVYSWTIDPPATTLEPGASASFNSAEVDVPQGGVYLRVELATVAA
ncbi:MAG TPA: zinc-ribbon domain-containing protein [Sphingomicrobium sp.]|jgi:predicted Zn finger-like uncharacterized protein|nr:zinc-ribbon domain-containing protein [Sphingomicrobium sp.]